MGAGPTAGSGSSSGVISRAGVERFRSFFLCRAGSPRRSSTRTLNSPPKDSAKHGKATLVPEAVEPFLLTGASAMP